MRAMPPAPAHYFEYDRRRRRMPRAVEGFLAAPVTTTLIALNVAVYLLDWYIQATRGGLIVQFDYEARAFFTRVQFYGHFSATMALYRLELWRLITFQFLHANFIHLAMNMVGLYIFGPMVERHLGSARFLRFYLICGVGGAVAYLVLLTKHILIGAAWQPLVGASAGIFGILIAASQMAPNAMVMMLFPPIPMRLRTLARVLLLVSVWTIFMHGDNAGGEAAHLGGAVVGFLLMQGERLMGDPIVVRERPAGYWDDE
jgi:membrane associated rhomboid family serine protease